MAALTPAEMIVDAMVIQTRASFRTPNDLRVHRQLLYQRAAPVFARHGYRESTLKELAAACGLSIPGLYRYFPSKRDFALYPLSMANRPGDCFGPSEDPLVHLRLWIDHAAWERPGFLLALRLASETQEHDGLSDEHIETFRFHVELVSDLLRTVAPALTSQRARELIESLLAMSFGASLIGSQWTPAAARTRFLQLLVPDLVRTGADPHRLGEALRGPHPPHGACSIQVAARDDFFAKSGPHLTERAATP